MEGEGAERQNGAKGEGSGGRNAENEERKGGGEGGKGGGGTKTGAEDSPARRGGPKQTPKTGCRIAFGSRTPQAFGLGGYYASA